MIEIDGSSGGGQLLRTGVTISTMTGTPVTISSIRGDRPEPGLRPQHLAVVELLAEICAAEISSTAVSTTELTFRPSSIGSGSYEIDVGTAGSVWLVCDAVLPLALVIKRPLEVTVSGGTDVKWAPTTGYYRLAKLPLLRQFGLQASIDVDRYGFYPVGGGRITLRLAPSEWEPLRLPERSRVTGARVASLASEHLAEASVAERQAKTVVDGLAARDIPVVERRVTYGVTDSPGSAVAVAVNSPEGIIGVGALGEPGVPSEDVAAQALDELNGSLESGAAVDAHTADQLMPFLAFTGGAVTIPELTAHVRSQADVLETLGYPVRPELAGEQPQLVASSSS